jgi:ankyrin repeat protein
MPAVTAVSKDDPAALWMLIRSGAHLSIYPASSELLASAASYGDPELIAAVMAGGIRPDNLRNRVSLLEIAARVVPADRAPADGRLRPRTSATLVSAVRLLLDAHADPEMIAGGGDTALTAAIQAGNYEVAELLLSRGARIDNRRGSGLDACGAALIGGDIRFGSLVFRSPGVSRLRSKDRLRLAAWNGDLGETNWLLDSGIDPNPPESGRPAALLLAAGEGHTEVVRSLLARGADPEGRIAQAVVELRRGGRPFPPEHTPLEAATRAGKMETARVLREHGARFDGR